MCVLRTRENENVQKLKRNAGNPKMLQCFLIQNQQLAGSDSHESLFVKVSFRKDLKDGIDFTVLNMTGRQFHRRAAQSQNQSQAGL